MKIHVLKCWPEPFEEVQLGTKTAEWRKDDGRGFEVGDGLILREWDPGTEKYSGREVSVLVTHLLRGPAFGVKNGYVVMSIRNDPDSDPIHDELQSRASAFMDKGKGDTRALFMEERPAGTFESAFARAASNFIQDSCENAPFGSVGGLEQRLAMIAPDYVIEQECCTKAYLVGYQEAARRAYGEDWARCEFRWEHVLTIEGSGENVRVTEIEGKPVGGEEVP